MGLLTAAQMRAIEQAAIESGEVTGLELMERAGRGVVEAIFEEWPELQQTSHRAVVLCGPGNNGGDGFVVARLLKEWGWEVEVFLYGDPDKLPPDARVNYERWTVLGEVKPHSEECSEFPAVTIDALVGTGLRRPVDDPNIWEMLWQADDISDRNWDQKTPPYSVAIDVASGLDADSGQILGLPPAHGVNAARAQLTVTFHASKVGHYVADGVECSGKLIVKDIGLKGGPRPPGEVEAPSSRLGGAPSARRGGRGLPGMPPGQTVGLIEREDIGVTKLGDHKYTHGHALILTGGPGKTGAARLAARGALRIGAGLVTLACPPNTLGEIAAHVTAIMCQRLDGAPGLREMLEDERLNALCLGPGMGLGADTQALVIEALKRSSPLAPLAPEGGSANTDGTASPSHGEGDRGGGRPRRSIVLDADALSRFERNPQVLFDLTHEHTVLTPHAGEFKRLFPDIAEKLNAPATTGPAYSKVDATREAAKRAGCTVLFKGPDTVIADQTGRCSINSSAYDRATPWLATAGSGDVLAGFITGLLARGFPPMEAAETAAWLHTECALSFGPGLIAEDLPEELPKVFQRLLNAPT